MAIFHCSIKIIGRGKGKSAIAAAAYREGKRYEDPETGIVSDYTHKGGVICSEVMLPGNAPEAYRNSEARWNSVQRAEKQSNAQLAREVEVALPRELSRDTQIRLIREYVQGQFVDRGMCAVWSLHDKGDGNPHAHIMLTMRGLKKDGSWAAKEKKEYKLDENGNRIPVIDPETGQQKIGAKNRKMWERVTVQANDWNSRENAEQWRAAWAAACNRYLDPENRVDHRSFKRQGIDQIPTIHEGATARKMEKAGDVSDRCEENREIREQNRLLIQIREWIEDVERRLQEAIREKARLVSMAAQKPLSGGKSTLASLRSIAQQKRRERGTGTPSRPKRPGHDR